MYHQTSERSLIVTPLSRGGQQRSGSFSPPPVVAADCATSLSLCTHPGPDRHALGNHDGSHDVGHADSGGESVRRVPHAVTIAAGRQKRKALRGQGRPGRLLPLSFTANPTAQGAACHVAESGPRSCRLTHAQHGFLTCREPRKTRICCPCPRHDTAPECG